MLIETPLCLPIDRISIEVSIIVCGVNIPIMFVSGNRTQVRPRAEIYNHITTVHREFADYTCKISKNNIPKKAIYGWVKNSMLQKCCILFL